MNNMEALSSQKEKPRITLCASFADSKYEIGTLGFGDSGHELFYQFSHPTSQRTHLNLNTRKTGPRLDHISWHTDGKSHIKAGKDRLAISQFPDRSFFPENPHTMTPLLVESFYLDRCSINDGPLKKLEHSCTHNSSLIKLSSPASFSVLLFLVESSLDVEQVLFSFWYKGNLSSGDSNRVFLKDLIGPGCSSEIIPAWEGYSLLIMTSNQVLSAPDSFGGQQILKAFSYYDLHLSMKSLFKAVEA